MRRYHEDNTYAPNGEIFVFGSNLAGRHGAGAARAAFEIGGAQWGRGRGLTGWTYAIPTKDERINTRNIYDVVKEIDDFVVFTQDNPGIMFFITRIGCGLAGFKDEQIAPLFKNCGKNCSFPENWKEWLK